MRISRAGTVAEVVAAEGLYDGPARKDAAERFLASDDHHLLLAHDEDEDDGGGSPKPVGFVSGVEVTHPDKGTEMFLYELAVDPAHHRRGIGRALVAALAELARERGLYGMWVLTDRGNPAALATYRSAGAEAEEDCVMLTWTWPVADGS
ncbi:GNAT family N-acetyltransferase [Streptacidiphilus sp. N1-3]|uniref:GNAT family N-acetyltransferase n=1 Tax=Streptacidiphilus alkalitolerans TaxID=3342712 RepID=A0ABV6WYY3_9ACTN